LTGTTAPQGLPRSGRRIGLLGGSFNPPHLAHLALGQAARAHLGLDELRWLPAGAPWQKPAVALADGAHRAAMLRLLLAGEPGSVVDERELRRAGPTYTLDTVCELQAEQAADTEWVLVIGQDQFNRFDTWHGWQALAARVTLAVAARAGQAPQIPAALAAQPHRWVLLPLARHDISASDIRARLGRGEPVDSLVGPAVAGYIARHHLYPPSADRV